MVYLGRVGGGALCLGGFGADPSSSSHPHPTPTPTGRFGLKLRRFSHVVVRLKEVDFAAALRACTNRFQRARWEQRQKLAEDVRRARGEEARGGASAR